MPNRPLDLTVVPTKRKHPPTAPRTRPVPADCGPSPLTILEGILTAVLVGAVGFLLLSGLAP